MQIRVQKKEDEGLSLRFVPFMAFNEGRKNIKRKDRQGEKSIYTERQKKMKLVKVVITYESKREATMPFQTVVEAARYAEALAELCRKDIISVLMKGPDGEREFIS